MTEIEPSAFEKEDARHWFTQWSKFYLELDELESKLEEAEMALAEYGVDPDDPPGWIVQP